MPDPTTADPIVAIAWCSGTIEGEMWVEALRRRGIPAILKSPSLGALPAVTSGAKLYVLESQAETALEYLAGLGLADADRLWPEQGR